MNQNLLNDLTNEMRTTPLGYISNSVNEFQNKKDDFSYLDIYSSQICSLIEIINLILQQ